MVKTGRYAVPHFRELLDDQATQISCFITTRVTRAAYRVAVHALVKSCTANTQHHYLFDN